jgi:hypothetical protein
MHEEALAQDPTIFEYDAVLDDIHAAKDQVFADKQKEKAERKVQRRFHAYASFPQCCSCISLAHSHTQYVAPHTGRNGKACPFVKEKG